MNWTLENVIEFIEACYDRDTILDVLMGYSGHWFPSRMVLIVGRAWVQLFSTTAFELPADLPRELRRADVDDDADAINDDVVTGTASEVGFGTLFHQLELGDPLVRTLGVKIGTRVAIVLVGLVHDEEVDTGALEAAATAAGRQLEDVIRMAKSDELPPPDERIPPFPEVEDHTRAPVTGTAAVDGRTTQNLEDFDANVAVSTPRLSLTVPDDDSSGEEEVNANATSFGLPFVKGDVAVPGREVADDSQVSESGESRVDAISEASGTREGAAFVSEASQASEVEQAAEPMISSPFDDEKFPGDIEEPEELEEEPSEDSDPAIELGKEDSGVRVFSPTDVSSAETKRTQLGGLSASADVMAGRRHPDALSEASEAGPGTLVGQPNMISEAKHTHLGGVGGEEDLVSESLERAESQAIENAASDAIANGEAETSEARQSGPHGAWVNARTAGGVPAAMILKPARKRRQTGDVKAPEKPAQPQPKPKPPPVPEAARSKPVASKPPPPPKISKDVDATRKHVAPPRPHDEPTRVATSPVDSATVRDPSSSEIEAGRTSFGAWNRDEDNRTRKFDADGEVDDAWFDYFADEAENTTGDKPDAALNFSLSEPSDDPHTIPPETLERLLDSGPEMVDMQEQFMILDSRDREKAFEAAERVAELGEKAVEVLDLMFPGRVFLDRYQYADDLPPVDKHGPVLHALVRLGDLALPVASRHLTDTSNEARFYAVYLLTKLDAEPVLHELFTRLFDRDQQIRTIAAELVVQYQSSAAFDEDVRAKIRAELLSKEDVHVTVASGLLARLRDTNSVSTLIDAMDDSATPRVKLAILSALTEITLHSWSSPYEWRQWWQKAKNQTREEWLVEALDAASSELRRQAFDEVQRIPGLELNYHPEQPSKLRKRAQDELRSWFEKAG